MKKFITVMSIGFVLLFTNEIHAQTAYTWTGTVNNAWDVATTANWLQGGTATTWVNSQMGIPTTATFGATGAGIVNIVSGGVAVEILNINSNYTFNGGPLQITMTNGDAGATDTTINVTAGVNFTLNSAYQYTGTSKPFSTHKFNLGANSVMNMTGGGSFNYLTNNNQWNISAAGATLNIQSGTYTGISTVQVTGTVNQGTASTGAAVNGSIAIGANGDAVYTMTNTSSVLGTTGGSIIIGSGTGTASVIRQTQLNIAGGLATTQFQVYISNTANTNAQLNVSSGTLQVTSPNATANGMFLLPSAGAASNQTATFNLSGGTVITSFIAFGGGTTTVISNTNSTAALNITGGQLYLGSGAAGVQALRLGNLSAGLATIQLGGGTIGAVQNWASSMNMTLTGSHGNITFQAADQSNTARNITLSGVLSGTGGLIKSGGGTLLLQGANTYTGNTVINAGILTLDTTGVLNFALGTSGVNNSLFGTGGTVNLNGGISIDLTNAASVGSWQIINSNNLTLTYGAGFTVEGWTWDNGNTWTLGNYSFNKTTGIITAIPEPSVCILLGFGLAVLVVSVASKRRLA